MEALQKRLEELVQILTPREKHEPHAGGAIEMHALVIADGQEVLRDLVENVAIRVRSQATRAVACMTTPLSVFNDSTLCLLNASRLRHRLVQKSTHIVLIWYSSTDKV